MAEEKFISVKEMFDYMRSAAPFSITWVMFDKNKGSGGGVKQIERAVMLTHVKDDNADRKVNHTTLNYSIKNPNHFNNSSFNIRIVASGEIKKVHAQLVRRFNGATVK